MASLCWSVVLVLLTSQSCSWPRPDSETSGASRLSSVIPKRFTVPAGTTLETTTGQVTTEEPIPSLSVEQHTREFTAILLR